MNKIQKDSFADGIRALNTRGALVIPVRLTKHRAIILLDIISRGIEDWNMSHEEGHFNEHDVQAGAQWVRNQISKRWSQNELHQPNKKRKKL